MFRLIKYSFEALLFYIKSKLTNKQFIFFGSVLVAISVAFAVIILKTFAHSVFAFANYINGILHLSFINSILPLIGIVLTVFVIQRFLGGAIEKGTSQILYAVAKKSSLIPKKQMYAQIITSSLTVGLGGSAGLESPIVITGSAFGSNFGLKYKLNYADRTLLIGCGVAAGIAAAFNAPIAGVLFAIEVLLVDVSISAFTPIMIAAATGALVSKVILNDEILLNFDKQQNFNFHFIPFYILLGLCTGIMAVYYSKYFQKTEHFFSRLKLTPYRKAILGAGILSVLIFLFPTLFGEGYESIKSLSSDNPHKLVENTLFAFFGNNFWAFMVFILAVILLKAFATGLTIGSGGNGGNFAPSLFLGSYIGFLFSSLVNKIGFTTLPVSNFTLVGMAGILSGIFHAPLTAIFLIAEITGGYNLMVPLMIVSSISFAVSKKYDKYSLDVRTLVKKGQVFTNNKDTNVLATLDLNKIVQTDYITVTKTDTLTKLIHLISHSSQVIFPVLDSENKLLGLVIFNDIREIIFDQNKIKFTTIEMVMSKPNFVINYTDSMETIMGQFEQSKLAFIPVLKDNKYYGFIAKSNILEAYRNKLKEMIIE